MKLKEENLPDDFDDSKDKKEKKRRKKKKAKEEKKEGVRVNKISCPLLYSQV